MRLIEKFFQKVGIGLAEKVTIAISFLILTAIWAALSAMNNGAYNGSVARKQNDIEHPQLKAITDTLKMNDVKTQHCIELIQKDIEEINARDEREYQMLRDLYNK